VWGVANGVPRPNDQGLGEARLPCKLGVRSGSAPVLGHSYSRVGLRGEELSPPLVELESRETFEFWLRVGLVNETFANVTIVVTKAQFARCSAVSAIQRGIQSKGKYKSEREEHSQASAPPIYLLT
jgi:hypothetical protein